VRVPTISFQAKRKRTLLMRPHRYTSWVQTVGILQNFKVRDLGLVQQADTGERALILPKSSTGSHLRRGLMEKHLILGE
jgi:hypothetical protein